MFSLDILFGIQGDLYDILAQMIHARIRLSSNCIIPLIVTYRVLSQQCCFQAKRTPLQDRNKLKLKIDMLNSKNQQKTFVIKKRNLFYIINNQILAV